MATLNGAKALNWHDEIGSLESGKFADFIAIDIRNIDCFPTTNMASAIVYGSSGSDVSHCWVGGKALMENSELKTIRESDLVNITQKWSQKLSLARSTVKGNRNL